MIIVDTSVWIDNLGAVSNAHTIWLDRQIELERVGLTDLILCEVLQGIRREEVAARTRSVLKRFVLFESGSEALAVDSAQNYRFLRRNGFTIRKTIDCLIASFCIREGHRLLHRDRDFDLFEQHLSLNVIHP